jgi:hypothetical protein
MAEPREYGYFIKGNKIALIEKDTAVDNDVNSKDYGPDAHSTRFISPKLSVTNGIELEYIYSPKYHINETNDVSTSIGNYMSDSGNLVITSRTATLSAFANGTDGDNSDVTVTSVGHGFSNGDSVIITGTSNYNGTYTIDEVTTDTFDIEDTFASGETTGSSTTLATLNVNYGNLGGYNISDGSYIVLRGADQFNGLHKTITKDAHNTGTNNKIKLETKYSGSTELSSLSNVASLYYNIDTLNDESDELPLSEYLSKAVVYYLKAKMAEDQGNFQLKDVMMKEFYRIVEKSDNAKIHTIRKVIPHGMAIR